MFLNRFLRRRLVIENPSVDSANKLAPKAPPGFTEVLEDFSTANKKSSIIAAWMTALTFGWIFVLGGLALGGWPLAIIAALLVLAWPIMTKYSYEANIENFRYYTWVYRTTKPKLGRIEVITSRGEAGIIRTANVWIDEKLFQCEVVPNTDSPMKVGNLAEGIHEMPIYVLPDSGEPLCAELGDMRIWLEPSLLRTLKGDSGAPT